MQVSEIPVGVSIGSHALIDLENVHAGPRYVFVRQCSQHDPWSVASADRHDESTASGDRSSRIFGDDSGSSRGCCIGVCYHFKRHDWLSGFYRSDN